MTETKQHKTNPHVALKRAAQRANYVVSDGQVPNPDPTDWRKPALSVEEAEAAKSKKGKQ